jgi:hypothetical protein
VRDCRRKEEGDADRLVPPVSGRKRGREDIASGGNPSPQAGFQPGPKGFPGSVSYFFPFLPFLFLFSNFFYNFCILASICFKPKPKVFKYSKQHPRTVRKQVFIIKLIFNKNLIIWPMGFICIMQKYDRVFKITL